MSESNGNLPKQMKAAIVKKHGKPLAIEEIDIPRPGFDEVLVRVHTSGVCHTDLHVRDGDWHVKSKLPIIPGHEGAGVVVQVGDGVSELKVGDRVGHAWLHDSCQSCMYCLTGWETVCAKQKQTGFMSDGCYAEYTVVKAAYAVRIPEKLAFEQASPLLCAGVTVYKGLKETEVKPGGWVAILGASGGLGHVAVQYAHAMGMRVCAVDKGQDRVQYCLDELKADSGVDAGEYKGDSVVEAVKEACGGVGAHGVLILAPSLQLYSLAVPMLRPRGVAVAIALPEGKVEIDIFNSVLEGKTFRGSIVGTRADMLECLELAAQAKIHSTIQERRLEDINSILEDLQKGKIKGRVVLRLDGDKKA